MWELAKEALPGPDPHHLLQLSWTPGAAVQGGCLLLGPPPEPTAEKSPDLGEGKLALGAKVFEEAGQRAGPSSTPAKVGDNSDLDGRVGWGFLKHS